MNDVMNSYLIDTQVLKDLGFQFDKDARVWKIILGDPGEEIYVELDRKKGITNATDINGEQMNTKILLEKFPSKFNWIKDALNGNPGNDGNPGNKIKTVSDVIEKTTNGGLKVKEKLSDSPMALDNRDEDQIVRFLEGEEVDEYIYEIKRGDKAAKILSYAGIMKVVREQGNIEVRAELQQEKEDMVRYKATAKDLLKNVTVEGLGTASVDHATSDFQKRQTERFLHEIAFSKAIRNAVKQLIDKEHWANVFFSKREEIKREVLEN